MAATRIYAVEDANTKRITLVEATTPAQARGHCARKQYKASVATQKQIVDLMLGGQKPEKAGDEDEDTLELLPPPPSGSEKK